ncbi:MAG: UbiA family prenyltransferase [Myxococcales bacterium]|nr:UbiA family prenyltransferase [Myxococcales bacterium]
MPPTTTSGATSNPASPSGVLATLSMFLGASRFHIVIISFLATMTFSWLFSGIFGPLVALVVAIDWWILDVGNKISDLAEDLRNNPTEARWVSANERGLSIAAVGAFLVTLALTPLLGWLLVGLRVVFQLLGVFYNFRSIPWFGGRRTRFKDLYAVKNPAAGVLFLLSVIGYPLAAFGSQIQVSWAYIGLLALFFLLFENSFEVIYDLKDIPGDRAEGIPTFPAVHGDRVGLFVVAGLASAAAIVIVIGYLTRVFGFRELLIVMAPLLQLAIVPIFRRRGYRAHDTVWITHLGSAQLAIYLTYAWLELPIPPWS